ncbi:hypothetical protein CcI156_18965 [Frankia sp. CcI156]|uniref:glycosyltransferase n=1 Tax=unclassified Frankia TaxID=2632575 RepID=UPI0003CFFF46|nr:MULTISPECIES: glycosyltransferase [unclassified Frankia]ETA00709.1 glycosyltransferase [Frankia sp. CcI6]KDA41719.1 glycosyltransferase [Frankia sp. BMG5.23]OHV51558.1 hypothetical protein CgIS1_18670 [Frankia sp. CgIS1]ONH23346.1 hypothetical protein CcI156_18965 [Frankia sp. CcI156]TFE24495.1 glycosyltransferase [Frankia sp. B2]
MKIVTLLEAGDGPRWPVAHAVAERESGDRVIVLMPPPDHVDSPLARELTAGGVEVVASPVPHRGASIRRQAGGILRLRAELAALGADVVHYHHYASAVAARLATVGTTITRVYMVANPLHLDHPLIRPVERVLCRLDHLLIAPTSDVRCRYAALGQPVRRLRTVSYGVDLDRFTPADDRERRGVRTDLDLPENGFVAVRVAHFHPPGRLVHPGRGVAGHEVLLAAWSRFVELGGRGTLILVDGAPEGGEDVAGRRNEAAVRYRERVRVWAGALPGAAAVRWVHGVRDVRPYYAAADVNVVSSWVEDYGAIGVASACGVPTVATRVGAISELVDDETGWLVAPGDAVAVAECLTDAAAGRRTPAARDRGFAARARAEKLLDRRSLSQDVVAALHEAVRGARSWHACSGPGRSVPGCTGDRKNEFTRRWGDYCRTFRRCGQGPPAASATVSSVK